MIKKKTFKHTLKRRAFLAFTLSEVLIALVVIGVVAAMTIPALLASYTEQATMAQLEKTYSTFSQLVLKSYQNGEYLDSVLTAASTKKEASTALANYFKKYLSVAQDCGLTQKGCFGNNTYYKLNGDTYLVYDNAKDRYKARLADGTSVAFYTWDNAGCTDRPEKYPDGRRYCGQFYVDINGDKKPNKLGVDLHSFYILPTGLVPEGVDSTNAEIKSDCLNGTGSGWTCTYWIIKNRNMDYLHCKDLDPETKTTCK